MLLMVLGSIIISFAGLIIRGIDTAGPLQITLYRGLALSLTILLILLLRYQRNTLRKITEVGWSGTLAGILLASAGICFMQAITSIPLPLHLSVIRKFMKL